MATIADLKAKLAKRLAGRRKQGKLFRKTGKRGHRLKFREHGKAARKLQALILRKIRQGRIDWNGCEPLPLSARKIRKAARYALNTVDGLYISSTVRYDSDTYHGPRQRRAVDFGSDDPNEGPEREAQKVLLEHFGPGYFLELFGPTNEGWVKNGSVYTASEGEFLETLHDNHTHAAA